MKNKKQRRIMFLLILILGITVGFALLSTTLFINGTANIKSNDWDIHWKSGSVEVSNGSVSSSDPIISGTNNNTVTFNTTLELPGEYFEFTIDAENSGSVDGMLDGIETTITDGNGEDVELEDYINYNVSYADGTPIARYQKLGSGKTEKYRVRIEYDEDAEELPNSDLTYNISTTVTYVQPDPDKIISVRYAEFDSGQNVNVKFKRLAGDTIITPSTYTYERDTVDTNITTIRRVTTPPSNINSMTSDNIISSTTSKYPIYAWYNNGVISYYTEAEDIYTGVDASYLFNFMTNLTSVDTSFKTNNSVYMSSIFYRCDNLPSVDLSGWNTKNAQVMAGMFSRSGMTRLDVSSFDTSNVFEMSGMFATTKATEIKFGSKWNTGNVTNMSQLFAGSEVTNLNLSNWDVKNVLYMDQIFSGTKLRNLNLSNWNLTKVQYLTNTFAGSVDLESVNLTNFNTSNVTTFSSMFTGCSSLTSLDLSSFDTANATTIGSLFNDCSSLETIKVSDKFVVDQVTYTSDMFRNCTSLVGGAGTVFDSNYIDISYAHIDGGSTNPGYFS